MSQSSLLVSSSSSMKSLVIVLILISCFINEALGGSSDQPVTCGSVVKLLHVQTGHHLHSHSIAWGSGSGQQSVTATGSNNDQGSLWLVKDATTSPPCDLGTPIPCGTRIRLEHVQTGRYLHSHLFRAPLTGNQEVSGFGDGKGSGDTGDNWTLICQDPHQKLWMRGSEVHFQHVDTGKILYTSEQAKFTQSNCGGGCPIMGQTEVSAGPRKEPRTMWKTGQGVYFPVKDDVSSKDEL